MKLTLEPIRTSSPLPARIVAAASLGTLLTFAVGCTSTVGGPEDSGANGGTSSGNSGSGGTTGVSGSAQGGGNQGGSSQGGGGGLGGDDRYTIPANPPTPVLVATPRLARLSRQQWSNTVRDLLKLPDISDVESDVTGDALVGFDNEADALYVTEQLRRQLFDASEKLADRVTADAAALARLVPADAPADAPGRARAFVASFGLRAFRRPLTDTEVT
ncbi:MAG TPA: DUF1587 domain-containing protein, partial [Polyangiaceae bacterium]